MAIEKTDVVIVGVGAVGGILAAELGKAGMKVVGLERGPRLQTKDFEGLDELRYFQRQDLRPNMKRDPVTWRPNTNARATPMPSLNNGNQAGGGTVHYGSLSWRMHEDDFRVRTKTIERYGKDAIPADSSMTDWPVSYAELEPYYDRAEYDLGISGKAGNINGKIIPGGNPFEAPRRDEYPQAPVETTEAGLIFKAACDKLGYQAFIAPSCNSSGAYTNPDGMKLMQCQYCGHCEKFICEAHAKATPEVLLYPVLAQRKNFEIRMQCRVTGLDYDKDGKRVTGVRYVDMITGAEYEQPADVVVLAAFTMSNTRFLLMGGIGKPYDPATGEGVVGKNFCYQTSSAMNVFVKDRWINPFLASGSTGTTIDEFNNDNFDHSGLGFLGGAGISANLTNGRPIGNRRLPPGTPLWGTKWKQASADWYAKSFSLQTQGSSYPHRDNYLSLDPDYQDAYGEPLVRITFDWRDNDMKMSEYCTTKMADVAKAMDATILSPAAPRKAPFDTRQYQSTHVTGGTPMGADPKTSVVSQHLQHWDAQNLFVVGASTYPHNSGYNPTALLGALALRLGDDLNDYVERPRML